MPPTLPPREHCETVFINPAEVTAMEDYVETVRPSKPSGGNLGRDRHQATKGAVSQVNLEAEDDFEPGLHVPASVLNECRDSFVAADANHVKASTSFFFQILALWLCYANMIVCFG